MIKSNYIKLKHQNLLFTQFLFVLFEFLIKTDGKTCPGICIEEPEACYEKGGKIIGHCTNDMNCCDVPSEKIGSCGGVSNGTVGLFQSPNYPKVSSTSLNCKFTIGVQNETLGILIEFIDFESDGHGFVAVGSPCENDYLFIRGFDKWMPSPICGYYSGYSLMIERNDYTGMFNEISLLALMSSDKYKWKIKITQLLKRQFDKKMKMAEKAEMKRTRSEERNPQYDSDAYGPIPHSYDIDFHDTEDSSKSFEPSPYIVNGEDTNIESIPWQASLRLSIASYKYNETIANQIMKNCSRSQGIHFCGGSIISDNLILTASHCFYSRSKKAMRKIGQFRIFVGDDNLCEEEPESSSYKVESILFHLAYDETMFMNDIAIVKIQGRIIYTNSIKLITLSPPNRKYEGRVTMASGWGLMNLTDPLATLPPKLQSANNFVIQNSSFCRFYQQQMLDTPISSVSKHPKYKYAFESIFCTYSEEGSIQTFVGPGDSGGPLVLVAQDSSKVMQVGIVSYGLPGQGNSSGNFIDYFQSVSFFRTWIDLAIFALQ